MSTRRSRRGRLNSLLVVIDASTLVSAALKSQSIPEQALLTAIGHPNRVAMSTEVETEYSEVLFRTRFDRLVSRERRSDVLGLILGDCVWVQSVQPVHACIDPDDDKYLALALAARADVIVSGDRHLLDMNPWRGIAILRAAEFVALH